jgi:hypothetical protein
MPERDHLLGLDDEALLRLCEVHTYRAHGPGGQHRNTTDSAVRLVLRGTAVMATAADSRSQHQNRAAALRRLRLEIALGLRQSPPSPWPGPWPPGARDARYPLYLATLLDHLAEHDYQVGAAAVVLGLSTGRLVRLLAHDDDLWTAVNAARRQRGHHPLRRE